MIARTLPTILPELTESEALEVTKIYSVTGNLPSHESMIKNRPFRAPHHTTSRIGLIGGGTHPLPGEISRPPGSTVSGRIPRVPPPCIGGSAATPRRRDCFNFPCHGYGSLSGSVRLVAASNPCPCGNYGTETKRCTCLPGMILRYQKRISGPIIDRIDLHIPVPAVKIEKLTDPKNRKSESSYHKKGPKSA